MLRMHGYASQDLLKKFNEINEDKLEKIEKYKEIFVYAENEDEFKEDQYYPLFSFVGKKAYIKFFFNPLETNYGPASQIASSLSQHYVDLHDFINRVQDSAQFDQKTKELSLELEAKVILKKDYNYDIRFLRLNYSQLFKKFFFHVTVIRKKRPKKYFRSHLKNKRFTFITLSEVFFAVVYRHIKVVDFTNKPVKNIFSVIRAYRKRLFF